MDGDRPRGVPPEGHRLPRAARIRKAEEIRAIFRRGKRRRTEHLDVFLAASPVSRPRLGLVVPKHRHEIVERNRLRRRLRDIGRTRVLPLLWEAGRDVDFMVRARREAYDASYETLLSELTRATEELCSGPSSSD